MEYGKVVKYLIMVCIVAAVVNGFVFASTTDISGDTIYDGFLDILILIQKYSWPVATLGMIFALYKYYVTGSEIMLDKMKGQSLIIGIAIVMTVIQCLPLVCAYVLIN